RSESTRRTGARRPRRGGAERTSSWSYQVAQAMSAARAGWAADISSAEEWLLLFNPDVVVLRVEHRLGRLPTMDLFVVHPDVVARDDGDLGQLLGPDELRAVGGGLELGLVLGRLPFRERRGQVGQLAVVSGSR